MGVSSLKMRTLILLVFIKSSIGKSNEVNFTEVPPVHECSQLTEMARQLSVVSSQHYKIEGIVEMLKITVNKQSREIENLRRDLTSSNQKIMKLEYETEECNSVMKKRNH